MLQNLLPNGIEIRNKETWWAIHIYNFTSFDSLLKYYVKPVVRFLYKKKLIKCFFFIRYTDTRGVHLRLRVYCSLSDLNKKVKPYVLSELDAFFNNEIPLVDCYTESPYEPETMRYGGKEAIGFAEEIFEISSISVLKVYDKSNVLDYDRALALGIQMNYLIGKVLLGLSTDELISLYEYAIYSWIGYADKSVINTTVQSKERLDQILLRFNQSYVRQEQQITDLICSLDAMIISEPPKKSFLNDLKHDYQSLNRNLQNVMFVTNNGTETIFQNLQDKTNSGILNIFTSYIHMNNNRLGILNRDEAFIAYLLVNAIKALSVN